MKKSIFLFFIILFCFNCICSVSAAPEDVQLLPLTKWNYKDVDGWGFYAKNGEYSWFAFVLHNPTDSDYTISLPAEVDVAHHTKNPIVNTAYKKLYFNSTNFLDENLAKHYFSGDLTLPKQSTYAVFMDITEMQPYSGQWDTDAFFSIQVKDIEKTAVIDIHGILAYDAYETMPAELTIVVPGKPVLTTERFCRTYSSSNNTISFTYSIRNNSTSAVSLELAASLSIEGQQGTVPVRYTGCTSGTDACSINKGYYTLKAGETASFSGEAIPENILSEENFTIKTALRYNTTGGELTPYLIGAASDSCDSTPSTVDTTEPPSTAEPTEPVTTPEVPVSEPLTTVKFCRSFDEAQKKVIFSYALRNNTNSVIPLEVATTLAVEGLDYTVPLHYTACLVNGDACDNPISHGIYNLKARETVELRGEADLNNAPEHQDFNIKTSLRYDYNGERLIPFFVGSTASVCKASPSDPSVTPTPDAETKTLSSISFCRNYTDGNKDISFTYVLHNNTAVSVPVELAATLAVEGQKTTIPVRYTNCNSAGQSCMSRIQKGILTLNPRETAELTGTAVLQQIPEKADFYIKTSLRYHYNGQQFIPFFIGITSDSCTAQHAATLNDIEGIFTEQDEKTYSYSTELSNFEDHELTITPGMISIEGREISDYIGTVLISAMDEEIAGKDGNLFLNGEPFVLPPHTNAEIELTFKSDVISSEDETTAISWDYSTNYDYKNVSEEHQPKSLPETENTFGIQFYRNEPSGKTDSEKLPAPYFPKR